jgi:hypothetical protein
LLDNGRIRIRTEPDGSKTNGSYRSRTGTLSVIMNKAGFCRKRSLAMLSEIGLICFPLVGFLCSFSVIIKIIGEKILYYG